MKVYSSFGCADAMVADGEAATLRDWNDRCPECHCGKDGHALNSINCPVHGKKAMKDEIEKLRAALESIAEWRKVNISGEYEHGLRDIIRSITDCAQAALEASPLSSHHHSTRRRTDRQRP